MPVDPGFNGDQCVFVRGNIVHPEPGIPGWLSTDIDLKDVNNVQGPSVINQPLIVGDSYRWQVGRNLASDCSPGESLVELWVGPPGPVPNINGCRQIGVTEQGPLPNPGNSNWHVSPTPWQPLASDGAFVNGKIHGCLVARCYPAGQNLTPDPNNFHFPDDPHVAQHNVTIVNVANMRVNFPLQTGSLNREEQGLITLRVVADLSPSRRLLRILRPSLAATKGFQRVATKAPSAFKLDLRDFPEAKLRETTSTIDYGTSHSRKKHPAFEAQTRIKPEGMNEFYLVADLSKSREGDAHVFHITQHGKDKRLQGGVTVVAVVAG